MNKSGTIPPLVELWTDGGEESERLRKRLDGFGIAYNEEWVGGENVPALNFGGTVYTSRDGINLVISTLIQGRDFHKQQYA